jgi:hypothetical protein
MSQHAAAGHAPLMRRSSDVTMAEVALEMMLRRDRIREISRSSSRPNSISS